MFFFAFEFFIIARVVNPMMPPIALRVKELQLFPALMNCLELSNIISYPFLSMFCRIFFFVLYIVLQIVVSNWSMYELLLYAVENDMFLLM